MSFSSVFIVDLSKEIFYLSAQIMRQISRTLFIKYF